jgi:hypothetical protein
MTNDAKTQYYKWDKISDTQGLERAYKDGKFYKFGNTLYVAGSNNARAWYDDLKIPLNKLEYSERYQDVLKKLEEDPSINNLVGHSLGSSVILQLQKERKEQIQNTRAYSSPVLNLFGSDSATAQRYRNAFDPVAILDTSATTKYSFNPFSKSFSHDYRAAGSDNIVQYGSIPVEA